LEASCCLWLCSVLLHSKGTSEALHLLCNPLVQASTVPASCLTLPWGRVESSLVPENFPSGCLLTGSETRMCIQS
jgi:hypothetical protein